MSAWDYYRRHPETEETPEEPTATGGNTHSCYTCGTPFHANTPPAYMVQKTYTYGVDPREKNDSKNEYFLTLCYYCDKTHRS